MATVFVLRTGMNWVAGIFTSRQLALEAQKEALKNGTHGAEYWTIEEMPLDTLV